MKQLTIKAPNAPPIATLEAGLEAARVACEAALDEFNVRNVKYNEALSQGDRAAVLKCKTALTEAEVDRDMAVATVTRLERELVEARDGAEHARLVAIYEKARAARNTKADRLKSEYPKLVKAIENILSDCREADELVDQANRNLPPDFAPLDPCESHVRFMAGRPREVLSEEIVECWAYEATGHRADITSENYRLITTDNLTGVLRGPESNIRVRKARFKKLTVKPAKSAVLPRPFQETLRLPSLTGDHLIFPHPRSRFSLLTGEETIESSPVVDEDRVEITFEPLELVHHNFVSP